jgi:hypothetical protein
MLSALTAPSRLFFRATLPLTLEPPDDEVERVPLLDDEQLRMRGAGQVTLVIGGTRGIVQCSPDS